MSGATDPASQLATILARYPGNSCAAQRQRILAALRTVGPLTTQQIQFDLDVTRPGARMSELRSEGTSIKTFWAVEETPAGIPHRFAKYVAAPTGAGEPA